MERKELEVEDIVMNLVVNSGAARSLAMEAIDLAEQGSTQEARARLEESREMIAKAHNFQTELISGEANGEHHEVSLILVHGQDHLMTAMVVIDLAEKFIDLYEKIN